MNDCTKGTPIRRLHARLAQCRSMKPALGATSCLPFVNESSRHNLRAHIPHLVGWQKQEVTYIF